jgi:hypothetical protein
MDSSSIAALTESDRRLLSELGLDSYRSIEDCQARIGQLTMRQLDRLKLMLGRIVLEPDSSQLKFSSETREGIAGNDLRSFAKAILELTNPTDESAASK